MDPKTMPGISPYEVFANNPILFTDLLGDKWKNIHEKALLSLQQDKNALQTQISNYAGDKSSKEFKKLNRDLKRIDSRLSSVQSDYDDVKKTLEDLQIHNSVLYNQIETLTDPNGTLIDVYVGMKNGLFSDVFGSGGVNEFANRIPLDGITDVRPYGKEIIVNQHQTGNQFAYIPIQSKWFGLNTATILIEKGWGAKGRTLSHEGGHVLYDVKHMLEYIKWLQDNPGKSKGGHGGGNPSGEAADREGKNYK